MPSPEPPPATEPPADPPAGRSAGPAPSNDREQRIEQIVAFVDQHPDGVAPGAIRSEFGLTIGAFNKLRPHVQNRVVTRGKTKQMRYFPKEDGTPRATPAPERRAASAPPRRTHARRHTEAADLHNARRDQIKGVILAVLEEGPSGGIGKKPLTEAVIERIPDASPNEVGTVRGQLLERRRIQSRANKVCLNQVDPSKAITRVEEEVVGCLGAEGRSAREVAEICDQVRNAFSARTILAALEQRKVIARRGDGEPAVYVAAEQLEEAA